MDLYYDGDAVARLLGDQTRQSNKDFIYQNFPFMKNYSIEDMQSGKYEKGINDSQIQAAIHVFASTPNPIVLTDEEIEQIEASSDPYADVVEAKVIRILGNPYSDEGCAGLDAANGVEDDFLGDEIRTVEALYENMLEAAGDSTGHLLGILLCERDGKIDGEKCDTKDFEIDWSTSGPSQPTEEELEILAEREAQAERDAQAPSNSGVTSNVTPGQICTSLGAMVETENYGSLTCKFVWVGKIRALMWMRS